MYWREGVWFLAGFAVAITATVELGTPHAYLVFVCGFVTRSLLALAVKRMYGTDLTTLWQRTRPFQVQVWRHALAFIKGEHTEPDAAKCAQCSL